VSAEECLGLCEPDWEQGICLGCGNRLDDADEAGADAQASAGTAVDTAGNGQ